MPVLCIGGAGSFGPMIGEHLRHVATDVRAVEIKDSGHWVAGGTTQCSRERSDRVFAASGAILENNHGALKKGNITYVQGQRQKERQS